MLNNKLEDLLWSLNMIKRSASSTKGCVLKDTGGFIVDGQVDDLIILVKEKMLSEGETPRGVKTVSVSERASTMNDFDKMVLTKNFGGTYEVQIIKDSVTVNIPKAVIKNQIILDVSDFNVLGKLVKLQLPKEIVYGY